MQSEVAIVSRNCRLAEWSRQILECQNRPAGMTVPEWCEQNGINKDAYYYRYREVKRACLAAVPEEAKHPLVAVPSELLDDAAPVSTPHASNQGMDIFYHDFRIHVEQNTCPDLLKMVLKVTADAL